MTREVWLVYEEVGGPVDEVVGVFSSTEKADNWCLKHETTERSFSMSNWEVDEVDEEG